MANTTLTSTAANSTALVESSEFFNKLQDAMPKQAFIECAMGYNSTVPYFVKMTTCIRANIKATQGTSIWEATTCGDTFYANGIAKQQQTCGNGSILIAQQFSTV